MLRQIIPIHAIVLMLLAPWHGKAQFFIDAGMNASTLTSVPQGETASPLLGMNYSAGYRHPNTGKGKLGGLIHFQYAGQGYITSPGTTRNKYRMHLFQMPFGAMYFLADQWTVEGGINLGFMYRGFAYRAYGERLRLRFENIAQAGIFAGAEFRPFNHWALALRYNMDMSSYHRATVVNADGSIQDKAHPIRMQVLQLSIRHYFN